MSLKLPPTNRREKSEPHHLQDPVTGHPFCRLTLSGEHDKHTYYDICPWSPDGKILLFSSVSPEDLTESHRDTLASHKGRIYAMDTESFQLRLITENAFYNSHTGTQVLWHPNGEKIYFYRSANQVEALDIQTGKTISQFNGGLRQLSPDGTQIIWNQPVQPNDLEAGIYVRDEGRDEKNCLVTLKALYELAPNRSQFGIDQMNLQNPKWSPNGTSFLVSNNIRVAPFQNDTKVRRSLFLISRDGKNRRWLSYFGHHYSWTPDGSAVIFCDWKINREDGSRDEPRLFYFPLQGSEAAPIIEEPLGGHPSSDPTGKWVVTEDEKGIILIDRHQKTMRYLTQFQHPYDMTHRGTQAHCVWSRDGKQILYNSAETGTSQLYLITLPTP